MSIQSSSNLTNVTNPRVDFQLLPDSPAIGMGPNGLDMGALVPAWASISGEPASPTDQTNATLTVNGPGIVSFRYRVNDGVYGAELPISNITTGRNIALTGLSNGAYTVYVIGKNSAGIWQPTNSPTASRTWTVSTTQDTDGDGMPDAWEIANNLDEMDAGDADDDPDNDGVPNLGEYIAGTDPKSSSSALKVLSSVKGAGAFALDFFAVAGKSYTVQYNISLDSETWQDLSNVVAQASSGPVQVQDAGAGGAHRYYRIKTPAQ